MKVKIRAAAERDMDEAASWYAKAAVDPQQQLEVQRAIGSVQWDLGLIEPRVTR